jgi:hypothetical protein
MLDPRDIEIPLHGWADIPRADGSVCWRSDAGDQLSLDFFASAPDLPAGPDVIGALRVSYRAALGESGGIVEVVPAVVAGVRAVRAIFKMPQDPTGMTYLGAVTIPFRDCSFIIKLQCPEYGVTGVRDAGVFALVAPPLDGATGEPIGWAQDPYDPGHKALGLRNRADDAEWDARFASHPLSRLRSHLRELDGVRFSAAAAHEPGFPGL